jgi:CRP-like cAMP-binding protein
MNSGEMPSLEQVLIESDWMHLLSDIAKERVLADARDRIYQPREVVARRGQLSDSWIGVASGFLKISSLTSTGRVVMFAAVPDGSWVGEGSVIKREPRKYEILALRETRVIHIPRPTFMWLLDTSVEFCRHVIDYLNERTGQFISMLEVGRINDPVARIAGTILILFNPILYKKVGPLLDMSQAELGELAGLSRPTTNLALNKLKALNLVNPQYGGILVLDVPKLRQFVEGLGYAGPVD